MEGVTRLTPSVTLFIYEFLGTAFLLLAIIASVGNALGIAFMLFALLLVGGPISGGHYNPAVTIGVFCNEKNKKEIVGRFILILLAQFTGAFFGVVMGLLCKT